jgi:hypothetical protein
MNFHQICIKKKDFLNIENILMDDLANRKSITETST